MSRRANVLWIMTDQHQAACLGCMGNPAIQTPNIDRLAAEGVCFENAFCQSPVCMASRASVMTGRYPASVRVRGMGVLPPSETTIAEWLARQGYATGAFGKVHLTPERYTLHDLHSDVPILDWHAFAKDAQLFPVPDDPFKRDYGFQVHVGCDDACQGNFRAWLQAHAPELATAGRPDPLPDAPGDLFVSPYPSEYHQTTYIAAEADRFIRAQNVAAPWFAFCSFVAPHHPFEAPADQVARYPLDTVPHPSAKGGVDITELPARLSDAVGEMDRYPAPVQRRIVQHYYASVSLVDGAVGGLIATLEATGQLDNTIVVFVADHGEMLGNHGLLRKPSLHYDELLRVPLIVRASGCAPRREAGLVELVDLYPTLLGLLGLPVNPGVQGNNLSGPLRNGGPVGRRDVYSEMHEMDPMVCEAGSGPYTACRTLRTADWKLNVYPCNGLACSQLFHLAEDPDETTNRFHDPAQRDRRERMLWRLLERLNADTDPLPLRLRQW
jgi:arylsulfatase A-like enzyme